MASSSPRVDDSGRGTPQGNGGLNCVVAQGTKIEGQLRSVESIRLDGDLIGDVDCEKRIVLGESGSIDGQMHCQDAVIMGHVKGEVRVSNMLHLVSSAIIEGNIVAKKIIIDEGARCHGECRIG